MPIFEYACDGCNHKFETLVLNGHTDIECPSCKGTKLRKLFSVFASVSSEQMPSFDGGSCGRCGSTERRCE